MSTQNLQLQYMKVLTKRKGRGSRSLEEGWKLKYIYLLVQKKKEMENSSAEF